MANIFMSLNTGVSGLNAAQIQISTTGNNITNADSNFYTRQRVVQSASPAMNTVRGGLGTGTQVDTIKRIFDEYAFQRLQDASASLENTAYKQDIMQEIAQYFPDLENSSIYNDMTNYFDAWNDFAANPDDGAQKINVVNLAKTFAQDVSNVGTMLDDLQVEIDKAIEININEINSIAEQIAAINVEINRIEAGKDAGITINANDLRDHRDELELAMAKLINVNSHKDNLESDMTVDRGITDAGVGYYLNIGGINVIDGTGFHPIKMTKNEDGILSDIYYEMEDGRRIDMSDRIYDGKIGAALDLRGRHYDKATSKFLDGTIQQYIDNLDSFANTLMHTTNNIYSSSAMEISNTDELKYLTANTTLMNYSNEIQNGSFDVIVYNNQGTEVARKTINVNGTTTIDDTTYGNSIVSDFNSNSDDNNDNNMQNDVNDYFSASYFYDQENQVGTFAIIPNQQRGLYSFAIEDNGTNFAGVVGINKFFDGNDASSMSVTSDLLRDPLKLHAYSKPVSGNNTVANKMVQVQYNSLTFHKNGTSIENNETLEGYYRFLTTQIASDTEMNNTLHKTNTSLFNTADEKFQSISGVNTNEELTNLIRFQASYGAAAKIVTTVNEMLDTLLTLKN
ncbi:MAG: flagellar hook-associated protein FlgK [Campylobacter sp.]|nr:flagellar hook-associated protein FlgK [Campylobacter sp.]